MADKLVDLIGIVNLLESLVAEDIITCEERDRVIAKIARENDCEIIYFTCLQENTRAQNFYRSLGYTDEKEKAFVKYLD